MQLERNLLRVASFVALAAAASLTACSGGGGGSGSSSQGGFQVVSISVPEGDTWEINRAIVFEFNQPVNFASVSLNTIRITDLSGTSVSGEFTLLDPLPAGDGKFVQFQPTCPIEGDYSDAGLQPGAIPYTIRVMGEDSGVSLTLLSKAGKPLVNSQTRNFKTPNSTDPAVVFFDAVVGPPSPVLHTPASAATDPGTYLEYGGDSDLREYFVKDGSTFSVPADVPLNLYSETSSAVAVMLEFDQPVNPDPDNISSSKVRVEFLDQSTSQWKPVSTTVELIENCTQSGATLRLEPQGILPQGAELRVVITSAFEDLVGDTNLLDANTFAHFETLVFNDPLLTPPDQLADELREEFLLGSSTVGSFEDPSAAFPEPKAKWGNDELAPAFDFTGTGGPGGNFDWVVLAGITNLDTTSTTIFGGDISSDPAGAPFTPTKTQVAVNGLVNVRHMRIDASATLRVVGPNPVVIQATGQVIIKGVIDISGFDAKNVSTLDTGNQPEPGSAGVAGGGAGGTGSFLTTTSTPKGGNGFGPFSVPNLGGVGGDSGFDSAASGNKENRRAAGGGGGALGANEGGNPGDVGKNGLVANPGRNGALVAKSAVTGETTPKGGAPGTRPFFDASLTNNFYGAKFDTVSLLLTVGELSKPWAGGGGGAGGDACPGPSFPTPSWGPASDEKGAGGGGAGGSLMIQALDDIVFFSTGRILCNGGLGGSGENTIGTDHIGGASGGGSGGHVILQAGDTIDFALTGTTANIVTALGGKWGLGASAAENAIGAGGHGGPGIIQLHTLGGAADILLPVGQTLANKTSPDPLVLVPTFGSKSRARSIWIPLGGAVQDPIGGLNEVEFSFGGTDTTTGAVLDIDANGVVDELAPVLSSATLVTYPPLPPSPVPPFIGADERTLVVDASSLAGTPQDIYIRNTGLLEGFTLRLESSISPANKKDFDVASATYDKVLQRLALTVPASGAKLTSFNPGVSGAVYRLIPRFFRVKTTGTLDALPTSARIEIRFAATGAKLDGTPETAPVLVPLTPDVAALNAVTPGTISFFQFELLFDLDALGTGLTATSPRPSIQFVRLPFRF